MTQTLTPEMRSQLRREIPSLTAEIRTLYKKLDRQFHLHGAEEQLVLDYNTEVLGSYTPGTERKPGTFRFSLIFIGYLHEHHLHQWDKMDLYKHEYAHYMQYHYEIPEEHLWSPGKHGSAWKYCCSLIGAAPTEYYSFGEGLLQHDYDKALHNPWKNPHTQLLDTRKREQEYQNSRNSIIQFHEGDLVTHPKFGEGTIENVEQLTGSVRLTIQFADGRKKIDQKWLVRSRYKAQDSGT